jgi:hypothetical protein
MNYSSARWSRRGSQPDVTTSEGIVTHRAGHKSPYTSEHLT